MFSDRNFSESTAMVSFKLNVYEFIFIFESLSSKVPVIRRNHIKNKIISILKYENYSHYFYK